MPKLAPITTIVTFGSGCSHSGVSASIFGASYTHCPFEYSDCEPPTETMTRYKAPTPDDGGDRQLCT